MYSIWIDESIREGKFLTIGGFYCHDYAIPSLVYHWREFKNQCGFREDEELHYQEAPSDLKLRIAEELSNWRTLTAVVATMLEMRSEAVRKHTRHESSTHPRKKRKIPVDFYCEGLRYILQRVAEESALEHWNLASIICDKPELGEEEYTDRTILLGRQAPFKKYRRWYSYGVGRGPGPEYPQRGLKDLNFQPSIFLSDPSYHDMLQIADCIVGITSKWMNVVVKGERMDPSWNIVLNNFIRLYRNRYGWGPFNCFQDGLIIHPYMKSLNEKIIESLESD